MYLFSWSAALVLLLLVVPAVYADVIEATDATFKSLVLDSGLPTILDIYASWCGHCQKLAPVWDQLGVAYTGKPVQIVKIDGDRYREAVKELGVRSYPTLKFFDGKGNVEDVDVRERDLESLAQYLARKTGVPSGIRPKPKAALLQIETEQEFDETIVNADRPAFVFLTARWCGHCLGLKKEFERAAQLFAPDAKSVLFAEVDLAGKGVSELATRYGTDNIPSVLIFNGDGSSDVPKKYDGELTFEGFVSGVNQACGLDRQLDGRLGDKAGLSCRFDALAYKFMQATDPTVQADLVEILSEHLPASELYHRYASKIMTNGGTAYIDRERARLAKLLTKSALPQTKRDELKTRLNVLLAFTDANGNAAKPPTHDEL